MDPRAAMRSVRYGVAAECSPAAPVIRENHGKRHPSEMGAVEVTAFLTALAVRERVAASTQNQALNALLFLYRRFSASRCHGSS